MTCANTIKLVLCSYQVTLLPSLHITVLEEIEERKEFLKEMEALGRGGEHRGKILTEISQRVRELELLDEERSTQLGVKDSLQSTTSKSVSPLSHSSK